MFAVGMVPTTNLQRRRGERRGQLTLRCRDARRLAVVRTRRRLLVVRYALIDLVALASVRTSRILLLELLVARYLQ